MRYFRLLAGLLLLTHAGSVTAQPGTFAAPPCSIGDFRLCQPPDASLIPPGAKPTTLRYGKERRQEIKFYRTRAGSGAPLVVVLNRHSLSGSSGWLRYRLNEAGYSVAFVRTSPPKTAGESTAAYAAALAYLVGKAVELDFDGTRLALFGTNSSARTAALLGTDPTILEGAGVPFHTIRAVIISGEGHLDVARAHESVPHRAAGFRRYYGVDPADLFRHSPVAHLAPPNAPAFLLMASADAFETAAETREAADAFTSAGIDARFVALPGIRPGARQTYFMLEPDGSGSEALLFLSSQLSNAPRP